MFLLLPRCRLEIQPLDKMWYTAELKIVPTACSPASHSHLAGERGRMGGCEPSPHTKYSDFNVKVQLQQSYHLGR